MALAPCLQKLASLLLEIFPSFARQYWSTVSSLTFSQGRPVEEGAATDVLDISGGPVWEVAGADRCLYETKISSPCLNVSYEEGGQRV